MYLTDGQKEEKKKKKIDLDMYVMEIRHIWREEKDMWSYVHMITHCLRDVRVLSNRCLCSLKWQKTGVIPRVRYYIISGFSNKYLKHKLLSVSEVIILSFIIFKLIDREISVFKMKCTWVGWAYIVLHTKLELTIMRESECQWSVAKIYNLHNLIWFL